MPVVVTKQDIAELRRDLTDVRIQLWFTMPMARKLLARCPSLERVIFTNTARSLTPPRVLELLKRKKIVVKVDLRTQGRPVELTRAQLGRIRLLREQGWSYRELAEEFGVSHMTIANVCNGVTICKRYREEYQ